jgi:tetratricopeptide (TPR) repeat protein
MAAGDVRTSSDRELADTYLRLGDPDNAARVYQQHLARYPGDAEAARSLGMAQLSAGRLNEGVEQIQQAYRMDPSLASRPISQDLLASPQDFERVLDLTTRAANASNAPGAWLASSAILQAGGSDAAARAALERARSAGLEDRVFDSMNGALPNGQAPMPAPQQPLQPLPPPQQAPPQPEPPKVSVPA